MTGWQAAGVVLLWAVLVGNVTAAVMKPYWWLRSRRSSAWWSVGTLAAVVVGFGLRAFA